MRKKLLRLTLLIILIFAVNPSAAQDNVLIDIILSPTLRNAQVVYISSFDFLQQGATTFLFQLTINARANTNGNLVFRLEHNQRRLARAQTNDFTLPAGIHTLNNIQLSNGYSFPGLSEVIKFDESNIEAPDSDFEEEVGRGGKLPAGLYQLLVEFYESTGASDPIAAGMNEFEVVSSAYVIPIAPGREGGLTNPDIIYTEFPVFQFNTDLINIGPLDPFNVQVYKVLADQHVSVDDVLSTTPHLDITTSFNLFQYPQNASDDQGGRLNILEYQPLETGTYLWRIILSLQTTSGTEFIQSPIFGFKVVDPNSVSENLVRQAAANDVFRILRFLIGDRTDEIENALADFYLSGIMVDGQPVELAELYMKISKYAGKVITIENIELLSSQE